MFTGIIEEVGRLGAVTRGDQATELRIETALDPGPVGSSLAVEGVCLTVTGHARGQASVTVGPETLQRTTLGALRVGDPVNLERPLRLQDRLGGHLVAGHVDAVGEIVRGRAVGPARELYVRAPAEVLRYVVPKGSIAVDGISLTVNLVDAEGFGVTLIPHTISATTLARKDAGARVNLEADLIGKYVEKFVDAAQGGGGGVTLDLLKEHGYA
ncbi:MAG: riboflavin synthase [Deltaproteobacteria bacterium]|nr:riboflavin synthase [Deltaproteobacteria bacterium]